MDDGAVAQLATQRFSRKRRAIIAAATEIINRRGVKGMTLAGVAAEVGLITTSVTYYFKKKEALAAACFAEGIDRLSALVAQARRESATSDRVRRLLELYLALKARIAAGAEPAIPIFSDIRALSDEHRVPIGAAYGALFRRIRGLLRAPGTEGLDLRAASARTQILLEQLHWSQAWLPRYDAEDYPRVAERMHDILLRGLALPSARWAPAHLELAPGPGADSARETFLLAATQLINHRGYRGASVEKISACLNVTKGSFYHHHSAKDDVVAACFERSFDVVRRVQTAARALPGDEWLRLTSAAAALVEFQFSAAGPLLRTSALSALPEAIREQMVEQSARVSDRFAAMISDGIAGGSLRPVDPFIAAQMLNGTLNAAADLPVILLGLNAADAVELYARPMFTGLLSA
ncbi:MAG: TetR/AcrR family transcriptional regulator [Caulobacterales bacterium]